MHAQYAAREEQLGSEIMRELERRVVLAPDRKWREHLYEMDYLQEGIGLRAMAQKNPLVQYQREGFDMFTAMMEGIKEELLATCSTWRSRSSSRSRRFRWRSRSRAPTSPSGTPFRPVAGPRSGRRGRRPAASRPAPLLRSDRRR
ncbi:hypothetical protein ACW23B_20315 [Streptomyces albidoflavus]